VRASSYDSILYKSVLQRVFVMHHSLRLYSRYRELFLRYYIFQARWTRIPLLGRLVRWVANAYSRNIEGAYLLTPSEAAAIVDCSEGLSLGPCT